MDRPTDLYITLDKLSLASRQYRLEVLPGQLSTSDQIANVLQIGWQERLTVHFRVVPIEGVSSLCELSECPFLEDAVTTSQTCVKSGAMDFVCLERAYETFEVITDAELVARDLRFYMIAHFVNNLDCIGDMDQSPKRTSPCRTRSRRKWSSSSIYSFHS